MRLQCHSCQLEFESASAPPYARCARCGSDRLGAPSMGGWGAPQGQAPAPTQWPDPAAPFGSTTPGQMPTLYNYGGMYSTNGQQAQAPLDTQGYLIASIVMLSLCCMPAGVVGIMWTEEAKKLHAQGRFEEAQKKLGQVKIALIVGPILGLVAGFFYFIMQVLVNLAH